MTRVLIVLEVALTLLLLCGASLMLRSLAQLLRVDPGFHPERVFAPGMPRFQNLSRDYYYDQIDAETEVYAVIGAPIEQSLSPPIHNAAFRHLGPDYSEDAAEPPGPLSGSAAGKRTPAFPATDVRIE